MSRPVNWTVRIGLFPTSSIYHIGLCRSVLLSKKKMELNRVDGPAHPAPNCLGPLRDNPMPITAPFRSLRVRMRAIEKFRTAGFLRPDTCTNTSEGSGDLTLLVFVQYSQV